MVQPIWVASRRSGLSVASVMASTLDASAALPALAWSAAVNVRKAAIVSGVPPDLEIGMNPVRPSGRRSIKAAKLAGSILSMNQSLGRPFSGPNPWSFSATRVLPLRLEPPDPMTTTCSNLAKRSA